MSLPLTDDNGVVQTIANGTPVSWNAGLGYDANGLLCVTSTTAATDVWINGWRRDAQGRLVVSQSTPEGQPFIYNAGWPTDKNTGAIITQQNVPAPTDPRIAGVAVGPLGGVYMTEGGFIWTPAALWPTGTEPGMWIDPSNLDASWADYTGTTPVSPPGTVADNINPVGLALDLRLGATTLTDPGIHLLQATSTARPLLSARVNLLTYTENFSSFGWRNYNSGMTVTTGQVDPGGGTTAVLLKPTAALNWHGFDALNYFSSIGNNTFRVYVKPSGLQYFFMVTGLVQTHEIGTLGACFDLTGSGSVVRVGLWNTDATIELHSSGYYICTVFSTQGTGGMAYGASNSTTWGQFTGDGTSGFYFAFPDLRVTDTASNVPAYQSVPGNGSTYTATGLPIFQKYDGTDDGMATAAFTAGTLTSAMDCMIAVRRDGSALPEIYGLYQADRTRYFGVTSEYSPNDAPSVGGCGTPTVWCDGVQLPGGTAVDRGAMNDALTIGSWHILEFRGLDLSAWNSVCFGGYADYCVNGAQGGILLFPGGNTAGRDSARAWLAAKVGVTLP